MFISIKPLRPTKSYMCLHQSNREPGHTSTPFKQIAKSFVCTNQTESQVICLHQSNGGSSHMYGPIKWRSKSYICVNQIESQAIHLHQSNREPSHTFGPIKPNGWAKSYVYANQTKLGAPCHICVCVNQTTLGVSGHIHVYINQTMQRASSHNHQWNHTRSQAISTLIILSQVIQKIVPVKPHVELGHIHLHQSNHCLSTFITKIHTTKGLEPATIEKPNLNDLE